MNDFVAIALIIVLTIAVFVPFVLWVEGGPVEGIDDETAKRFWQ
jgi:hypothetical protein